MDGFHPDCVVVTDSTDRIETTTNYIPSSRERIQRLISGGLTSQGELSCYGPRIVDFNTPPDSVYEYLTEKLIFRFRMEFDESKGTERIRSMFKELRDPDTGCK